MKRDPILGSTLGAISRSEGPILSTNQFSARSHRPQSSSVCCTASPGAKRRKDGTKRSHAEWATANGFRWFSEDTIPDSWIDKKARESEEYKKRNDKLNLEMQ